MVLRLVSCHVFRSEGLVSEAEFVDQADTAFPVSCKVVSRSRTVDVILPSGEIPHEISPVHPIELVVEEEGQILEECRLLVLGSCHGLSSLSHVCLVERDVARVASAPHSWEKHLS